MYGKTFYDDQEQGSVDSARLIVPIILRLLNPGSVVDIGCGLGTWLSVYRDLGVDEILGVDGSYVDTSRLYIDRANFISHDLAAPINLDRRFDLVQCLEVAEHIDKRHAERFIQTLTMLGDVVVFGAAIPYQLGTGHVNEQFADYWIKLFEKHDYRPLDCIRPYVWNNDKVEVWYRQNTLMFVKHEVYESLIHKHPELISSCNLYSVVHPGMYELRMRNLLNLIFEMAAQLHQSGAVAPAESLYQVLLMHDMMCAPVLAKYGQLLADSNRTQAGLDALNKAIDINPGEAWFWDARARVHARLNDNESAKSDFEHAQKLDSQYLARVMPLKV